MSLEIKMGEAEVQTWRREVRSRSENQDLPKGMLRKSQRKKSEKQRTIRLVRLSPVYFQINIKLVSEMHFKTNDV